MERCWAKSRILVSTSNWPMAKRNSSTWSLYLQAWGTSQRDLEFDLSGFSGSLNADQNAGNLELASEGLRFGVDRLFRNVLEFERVDGLAIWRATADGYRVMADGLQAKTPHGSVRASLELNLDDEFGSPVIDLNGEASLNDIAAGVFYLPNVLPAKVIEWLDTALVGGQVPMADFRISGPLVDFPFENDTGEFFIGANFENGVLDYAPDWPLIRNASGRIEFNGASMSSTENKVAIAGLRVQDIAVHIPDMRLAVVKIEGRRTYRRRQVAGIFTADTCC